MPIFAIFILFIALFYGLLVCVLTFRLILPHRKKTPDNQSSFPGISIVVPFKNEATNLPGLLASLAKQRYDGPVEVILVNDGSTDDYRMSLSTAGIDIPLQILHSAALSSVNLTSKQQALELGIRAASHDWIALTDADMILAPNWLSSLMNQAGPGIAMVFGHTAIVTGKSPALFPWFQAFQLETLFGVAYAFNRCGLTGSCMGNNLLISKKAFDDAGGYETTGYSIVEDCDLLRLFRKKKYSVVPAAPFSPTGFTPACTTLRQFYQQLLRWATGGFGKNPLLAAAGLLLGAQNLLFLSALSGFLSGPIALVVFSNLLLTWLFVVVAFRRTGSRQHPIHFWPFYLLFLVESLVLTAAIVFRRPIVWKERKVG